MSDPMVAMQDAVASQTFDEIVISTLPARVSGWLRQDLAHRAARRFSVPVTTITAADNTLPPATAQVTRSSTTTSAPRERVPMAESVYKIVELVGTSTESWEKAAAAAVTQSVRDAARLARRGGRRTRPRDRERCRERVPRQGQGLVQVRGRARFMSELTMTQVRSRSVPRRGSRRDRRDRSRRGTAAHGSGLVQLRTGRRRRVRVRSRQREDRSAPNHW